MPAYCGVIVESPSKCAKIESFLGEGYKCIATYGHFRDLRSLDAISFDNGYRPTYTDSCSKRDKISALRTFIGRAGKILLATDDDREGEAIAWHVCDRFGLDVRSTDRIVFHEITKTAIKSAVANPTLVDMSVVEAQQARQVLDLLVGFTVSPLLWKGVSSRKDEPLSAGRCQSPALRIIYDNQVEVDRAEGEAAYATCSYFTSKSIEMNLSYSVKNHDESVSFAKASASFAHIASTSRDTRSIKKAPIPFTTSLLQQKASSEFKSSPNATMVACQALYEKGLITYHRTDMQVYAEEFVTAATKYVSATYGSKYNRKTVGVTDKDNSAQAAHEAIRPTSLSNLEPPGLDVKQMKVYKLIHRNTLESCMADAEYVSKKLSISAPPLASGIIPEYKKVLEKCIFAGWQIVANKNKDDNLFDYVGLLSGKEVELNKLVSTYSIKKLKSHLTEAKLVQSLEKAGIGRPSTFSSLVDKIQSRKYVKKQDVMGRSVKCPIVTLENNVVSCSHVVKSFGDEKGKLVIQKLGTEVMEFLIKNFDEVFRYSFTREMEQKLDKIAQGELSQAALCSECHETIKRVITEKGLQKSQNLKLDAINTYIVGKYGPCIMQKKDGKTSFLKLKEGVTREMLIDKKLSLEELIVPKVGAGDVIGTHEGHPILLKRGRFGPFLRWRDKNYKWKGILPDDPTADQAIRMLVQDVKLTEDVWLKHNERGYYVMKRNPGAKPSFASVPSTVDCLNIRDVKAWLKNGCKQL